MCARDFERFYSVREMMNYLTPDHKNVNAMRTICPISNLASLKKLRSLQHPYLFNLFNKSGEQQVEEVRTLLEVND